MLELLPVNLKESLKEDIESLFASLLLENLFLVSYELEKLLQGNYRQRPLLNRFLFRQIKQKKYLDLCRGVLLKRAYKQNEEVSWRVLYKALSKLIGQFHKSLKVVILYKDD